MERAVPRCALNARRARSLNHLVDKWTFGNITPPSAAMRELGFVDVKSCFASNAAAIILFSEIAGGPILAGTVIMKGARI